MVNRSSMVRFNPPLLYAKLKEWIDTCEVTSTLAVLPPFDKGSPRRRAEIFAILGRDSIRLRTYPFCPWDMELEFHAEYEPDKSFYKPDNFGNFTCHYICYGHTDGIDVGPLYHVTSGLDPIFHRLGFGILAYLALMEIVGLFEGSIAPEVRFGGVTSPEAWRTWSLIEGIDEVQSEEVKDCRDYENDLDEDDFDPPFPAYQYYGDRICGKLLPMELAEHPVISDSNVMGIRLLDQFEKPIERWIEAGR